MIMETSISQQQIADLIEAAKETRRRAYAPSSRFNVGAAILGVDGKTYVGCNVENASFGLTICAERVAVANAIAHGCREFRALAVVSETDNGPATPCGACRQVLAEFCPTLTIICARETGKMRILALNDLLPDRFNFNIR
jgi:cytidine deaminase